MSVLLEIQDGSPWYLSPDIWTVPNDPTGSPGIPVAGEPCYLYARVRNNGTTAVQDAIVRFYWANPSVGFDRTTANFVGQSSVTLSPGQQEDVLCLTSWVPTFINGGHLCVLAEAFHPMYDALPAGPDFNVPTDRHVAQRNLSIVMTSMMMFSFSFEIHNPERKEKKFQIQVRQEKVKSVERLLLQMTERKQFGDLKDGKVTEVGFVDQACPSEKDIDQAEKERITVNVAGQGKVFKTLVGKIEGEAVLLHVTQHHDEVMTGGLSVLVLNEGKNQKR